MTKTPLGELQMWLGAWPAEGFALALVGLVERATDEFHLARRNLDFSLLAPLRQDDHIAVPLAQRLAADNLPVFQYEQSRLRREQRRRHRPNGAGDENSARSNAFGPRDRFHGRETVRSPAGSVKANWLAGRSPVAGC